MLDSRHPGTWGGDVCLLYTRTLIDELQRIRSLFKIVGGEPAQLSTMKMNSSRLGVGIPPLGVGEGSMGRWTGKKLIGLNIHHFCHLLSGPGTPLKASQEQTGHGAMT